MRNEPRPQRRAFEVIINRAITKDDRGECLQPQTMEGFASEVLFARRQGVA
jgi:hypothetical protein